MNNLNHKIREIPRGKMKKRNTNPQQKIVWGICSSQQASDLYLKGHNYKGH